MISLIITVLNEKAVMPKWFGSFAMQTAMPEEIIIVDGGSTDGTWEYLLEKKNSLPILKVLQSRGNIAHGRNVAITAAKGDKIVVTDAGCIYHPDWLRNLSNSFELRDWSTTGFAPWFQADDGWLVYAIAAATIPQVNEFRKNWLPSSRSVAFKKSLWQDVGGYPEWIPYCEDVIFDLRIMQKAGEPGFIREPLVFWRPRVSLVAYLRQLYNYTRSEGHGNLNVNRQLTRYVVYFGAIILFILGMKFNLAWFVLLFGMVAYVPKFWLRWWIFTAEKNPWYRVLGLFAVPVVISFGDVAKMVGFPVGVVERLIGKVKFQ